MKQLLGRLIIKEKIYEDDWMLETLKENDLNIQGLRGSWKTL